jgi:hypothetical protein
VCSSEFDKSKSIRGCFGKHLTVASVSGQRSRERNAMFLVLWLSDGM